MVAKASGYVNHPEAPTSAEFELPPSCQQTLRDKLFVAYDGRTENGSCVVIFATGRNQDTLAHDPNWIADGTFYVSPKQFYLSFSVHAVIDGKRAFLCSSLFWQTRLRTLMLLC
jgi:hypothetical protein